MSSGSFSPSSLRFCGSLYPPIIGPLLWCLIARLASVLVSVDRNLCQHFMQPLQGFGSEQNSLSLPYRSLSCSASAFYSGWSGCSHGRELSLAATETDSQSSSTAHSFEIGCGLVAYSVRHPSSCCRPSAPCLSWSPGNSCSARYSDCALVSASHFSF